MRVLLLISAICAAVYAAYESMVRFNDPGGGGRGFFFSPQLKKSTPVFSSMPAKHVATLP
jgi:hypothetical protein